MSKKRIRPEDLAPAIEEILDKYGEEVGVVVSDAIEETSQQAVSELRSVNRFAPNGYVTGDYSRDWDDMELLNKQSRFHRARVVYNRSHYQLTHLLEFGHALINGGRARAFPHIAPVNDMVEENLIRKVESRL